MVESFSNETQALLDAADRAIADSRDLADRRRKALAEGERSLRVQAVRAAFFSRNWATQVGDFWFLN
jgi:hypothetical protein